MTDYTRQTGPLTQLGAPATAVGATADADDGGFEVRSAAVESVASDSRRARPGDLSAATPGEKVHGAAFVASVAKADANAVLTDAQERGILRRDLGGRSVPVLIVNDPRAAIEKAAALILGESAADLDSRTAAGTNGKTATVCIIESILGAFGRKSGLIDAVEICLAGTSVPAHLTTPMSDEFQSYLAFHRHGGGTGIIMGASSHALVRGRSNLVRLTVAGFTNLTQGHLDSHGTMERYYQAEASLFTPERTHNAAVSADDEHDRRFLAEYASRLGGEAAALAADSGLPDLSDGTVGWKALTMEGSSFVLESTDGHRLTTNISLPGDSNVANAALAAVMVVTVGHSPDGLARALPTGINPTVSGRTEMSNARPQVIVDSAHNTEVLINTMKALRPSTKGGLVVLIGPAEDRDRGKRPVMGVVVVRCGNFVYTMDNDPHNEDSVVIRVAVVEGTCGFDTPVVGIVDRPQAIDTAITETPERDTILLARRGHETIQEAAGISIELDDRAEARRALRKRARVRDGEEKA